MSNPLLGLAAARREGSPRGMTSVCSAHPVVIQAAVRRAAKSSEPVLIEATCNQVNQYGGYTGMTPAQFASHVMEVARLEGLDPAHVIFGGDHLGPNPWRKEPAEQAMAKAEAMVAAFVAAGFTKIHLDASMGCAGEPPALEDEMVANRTARLAKAAEAAALAAGRALPLYIIGTEVPIPGGAGHAITELRPTEAAAARHTIDVHRQVFARQGLSAAFDRVIALVVQPGVEFGSDNVVAYDPALAKDLTGLLDEEPSIVYEAHSTDYQTRNALAALVRDGFPILKVGPGLTFALREALYGLDLIASEILPDYGDRPLCKTMERIMLASPAEWTAHYHGSEHNKRVQRHYSYSDRIRYYWGKPGAASAVARLCRALNGVPIPETLMRQFLPTLPAEPGEATDPERILIEAVDSVLADYSAACSTEAA